MTDHSSPVNAEALSACPICGSETIGSFEQQEGLFTVSCENDDCIFVVETHGASLDEAVKRWNMRSSLRAGSTLEPIPQDSATISQTAAVIVDRLMQENAELRSRIRAQQMPDPALGIVRSAYYAEATGPQEEAWNAACEHIEEGLLSLTSPERT